MTRATLLLLMIVSPAAKADDWPQWMGPNRDGIWKEQGLVDRFPQEGPKVVWKQKTGLGYAGPAVAEGKVFVADRELKEGAKNPDSPFGRPSIDGNERLLCLSQKTGEVLWKYEYPCTYSISYAAGPRCTPTVDGDRVYFLGAMGDLACVNVANGKKIWSKNFVKDYESPIPVWGFAGHPLVWGDKLICIAGGTNNRLVIAFDKLTGKEIWTSQSCQGDFGYCHPITVNVHGKTQIVIWHGRGVVGLEPETGKRLWLVPFEAKYSLTAPMPRAFGDSLFITSFYNGSMLMKFDKDGVAKESWRSKAKGEMPNLTTDLSSIMCTPIVEGEYIYGVCSFGELRCLKAETGERIWMSMQATRGARTPEAVNKLEVPDNRERWSNAFIVKNGDRYVIFNEQGDLIFAKLSPKGYEEISRAHVIEPTNTMAGRGRKVCWMHPAFAGKCVFVRNDEEIICLSLAK